MNRARKNRREMIERRRRRRAILVQRRKEQRKRGAALRNEKRWEKEYQARLGYFYPFMISERALDDLQAFQKQFWRNKRSVESRREKHSVRFPFAGVIYDGHPWEWYGGRRDVPDAKFDALVKRKGSPRSRVDWGRYKFKP